MDYLSIIEQLKRLSPQAIVLFGSQATATANPDSDVDILVVKETSEPFNKRIISAHRVLHSKIPVDVIVLTPSELKKYHLTNSFYKSIIENGKVLYGRI